MTRPRAQLGRDKASLEHTGRSAPQPLRNRVSHEQTKGPSKAAGPGDTAHSFQFPQSCARTSPALSARGEVRGLSPPTVSETRLNQGGASWEGDAKPTLSPSLRVCKGDPDENPGGARGRGRGGGAFPGQ